MNKNKNMSALTTHLAGFASCLLLLVSPAIARPNIIIVMTDDQGYGDLSATGNPC